MNQNRRPVRIKTPLTILGLLLTAAIGGSAQTLKTETKLWLEGDSTLHRYASTATVVNVSIAFEPAGTQKPVKESVGVWDRLRQGGLKKLEVTVPVKGLKSGERGLDKNMYAALKADQFPEIIFVMTGYHIAKDSATEAIVAQGDLSIAGVKKPETINASLRLRDGRAIIDGQQPLLMTDFGIRPPSLMLGALKTSNRVVVGFHLELEQTADEQKGEKK